MFNIVILLALLPRLPHEITAFRACTPNTQFLFNGRLCFCDNRGYLNEANCKTISRRQSCQVGQIIWQGCNQCICQENGYLLCSNSLCSDDIVKPPLLRQGLSVYGFRCTPYRSYYINCSICVCPASGIANEAQCVYDISCNTQNIRIDHIGSTNKVYCIPKVMYLTPCLHCLCPDRGYFDSESCTDTCHHTTLSNYPARRCIPGTFYRTGCNVCRCSNTSIADNSLCISANCNNISLQVLGTENKRCTPHSFTFPRCMYCDCNSNGFVNENVCLEIDCNQAKQLGKHDTGAVSCHPGQVVPICVECFCTRDGQTIAKYCSRLCSYQNRLNMLDIVLKDASHLDLIERSQIKTMKGNEHCSPNSLYYDSSRYCICPENGNTDYKLCTSVHEDLKPIDYHEVLNNNIEIDYSSPCEPNTFVQFDCNTCYCAKNGRIDPKWCTYDDCKAKRLIQELHKEHNPDFPETDLSGTCQPGAILKLKCNFCICPESGVLKEKACTQNDCAEFDQTMYNDKLVCEPLAYYEVDCNICYCPRDGIKNVAKCTKNQCEKSILRSDSCIPGQLFTDDCNLCICPPDGNKVGKACTNHICPEIVPGKLLQLSDDLMENHVPINYTKSLDHCFPGEEFVDGCKLCICPELGLKMFAICDAILCDELHRNDKYETTTNKINKEEGKTSVRSRRHIEDCFIYNVSVSAERKECTPGTVYIIRCKECICPYFGNINNFCRPMAKNMHCEQAFPYFNYLPMGRRSSQGEVVDPELNKAQGNIPSYTSNVTLKEKEVIQVKVKHDKHTEFRCEEPGTMLDKCFICDCEQEHIIIEEHCFKSDAISCTNAKPTFLLKNKVNI